MDNISLPGQAEDCNRSCLRIDNPIFRDPRTGVFPALGHDVTPSVFRIAAENLHCQVGSVPEFFTDTAGVGLQNEYEIRLAKLAGPETHADRGKENFSQVTL